MNWVIYNWKLLKYAATDIDWVPFAVGPKTIRFKTKQNGIEFIGRYPELFQNCEIIPEESDDETTACGYCGEPRHTPEGDSCPAYDKENSR